MEIVISETNVAEFRSIISGYIEAGLTTCRITVSMKNTSIICICEHDITNKVLLKTIISKTALKNISCVRDRLTFEFALIEFNYHIRQISKDLTLIIERFDPGTLYINDFNMDCSCMNIQDIRIPREELNVQIKLSTQLLCEMYQQFDKNQTQILEIKSDSDHVVFRDPGKPSLTYKFFQKDVSNKITDFHCAFGPIKCLDRFYNISNDITIFIKNNFPATKIIVGKLAVINIFIHP
jgi:hypothetical protein